MVVERAEGNAAFDEAGGVGIEVFGKAAETSAIGFLSLYTEGQQERQKGKKLFHGK